MHDEWDYKALEAVHKRLVEAVRPLIEGLHHVYKADGYWLRVSHPQVVELDKAFREATEEQ
jgi:hypothetical protein